MFAAGRISYRQQERFSDWRLETIMEALRRLPVLLPQSRARALLEAMARGLPAIATDVGGIPELLAPVCLVRPNDAEALANRVRDLMADDGARATLGQQNRQTAQRFHDRVQAPIRKAFLLAVRDASAGEHRGTACA